MSRSRSDLGIGLMRAPSDDPLRTHGVERWKLIGLDVEHVDHERSGILLSFKATLVKLLQASKAPWLLVAQEDFMQCRDFRTEAVRALQAVPSDVDAVVLFTGRKAMVSRAITHGVPWVQCPGATWGGSTALRREAAMSLLRFVDAHFREGEQPRLLDDAMMAVWAVVTGRRVWVTVPSLLAHIGDESLVGHQEVVHGRTAARFHDGKMPVDWSLTDNVPTYPAGLGDRSKRFVDEIRRGVR